jgi:hypothetical protein
MAEKKYLNRFERWLFVRKFWFWYHYMVLERWIFWGEEYEVASEDVAKEMSRIIEKYLPKEESDAR